MWEWLYYFFFVAMIMIFLVGNKICGSQKKDFDLEEQLSTSDVQTTSIKDQFCEYKDAYTLNTGVMFLCMAAFKAYNNRISKKINSAKVRAGVDLE